MVGGKFGPWSPTHWRQQRPLLRQLFGRTAQMDRWQMPSSIFPGKLSELAGPSPLAVMALLTDSRGQGNRSHIVIVCLPCEFPNSRPKTWHPSAPSFYIFDEEQSTQRRGTATMFYL